MHITPARQQFEYFLREADLIDPEDLDMDGVPDVLQAPDATGADAVAPTPEPFRAPRRTWKEIMTPSFGVRGPKADAVDPKNDPMNRLPSYGRNYRQLVNNLVSHYDGSDEATRRNGRFWYKSALDALNTIAEDTGVSRSRAVSTASAHSPQTDWDQNLQNAHNFLLQYPGSSPNDWRMSHLHPAALEAFQAAHGRDFGDDDLDALADLHAEHYGPSFVGQSRQDWIDNIRHHGIDSVRADYDRQVKNRPKKDGPYNPRVPGRGYGGKYGIGTLGGNVDKGIAVYNAADDAAAYAVLNGPKTSNFHSNIDDDTEIDDDGYYKHPINPRTGLPDWRHGDLGVTADSHHIRSGLMPHGKWHHEGFLPKGIDPTDDHTYNVFHRATLDATRRINSKIEDPNKHLTPKQVQAIIWLKHKQDNEHFRDYRGIDDQGKAYIGPVPPPGHRKRKRRAGRDWYDLPKLWQEMMLTRVSPPWTDLLSAWVEHHDAKLGPKVEQFQQDLGSPEDPDIIEVSRAHTAAFDDIYNPFDFAEDKGPHDNPWAGVDAEALAEECPGCRVPAHELCEGDCPTMYSDDPRDWVMDDRALGGPGGRWRPGPELDPMLRLNSVMNYATRVLEARPSGEELLDLLRKQHAQGKTPGYTFRDELGDAPTSGYMVSYPPDKANRFNKGIPFEGLTAEDIEGMLDAHQPRVDESEINNHGGWVDYPEEHPSGMFYGDASENIDDDYDALRSGLDRDQIAVVDLDSRHPASGELLPQAFPGVPSWAASGPANALGWTHANRRR